MSFVSIIARKNFVSVMSDGQVTGQDGMVLISDYQKFKKISENQFIAFAGAKEICEQIVNQVDYTEQKYHLLNIAQQINTIINEERFDQFRLFFAVGGIEIDNCITIYLIEHGIKRNFRPIKPINQDDIDYAFLNSEIVDSINMEEKLISCLQETGFDSPEECFNTQKMLNDFVETIDPTVNRQTYSLIIRK